jgi:uncharacterized protein (TIGR02147 family)
MRAFEFEDYRSFVQARIKAKPGRGHGEYRKMAEYLKVHTSLISQIFRGAKELNLEQATRLSEYLGLAELESEYFLGLVQLERAGSEALRTILRRQLRRLKEQAQQLSRRLPQDKRMSEEDKAIFYSNWYYSGVRILTSLTSCNSVETIAKRLGLPGQLVAGVVDFLVSRGLCVETKGKLEIGPSRIHLESSSPHVARHHTQWRLKTLERLPHLSEADLVFTAPLTVSSEDAAKIREKIMQLIEEVSKTVKDSEPTQFHCLNIDWVAF